MYTDLILSLTAIAKFTVYYKYNQKKNRYVCHENAYICCFLAADCMHAALI